MSVISIADTPTNEILATLFASSARAVVLRFFMLDPLRAYYQRQIEAATDLPIRAIQRELERLNALGLLYRHTEGNRAYYQVDMDFPLFPELREMVLKTCPPSDQIRGTLTIDKTVRLAFINDTEKRVLIISSDARRVADAPVPGIYRFEIMNSEDFIRAVSERRPSLTPFLEEGSDLLGRRDDIIWRRIEAAGYLVPKRKGVA